MAFFSFGGDYPDSGPLSIGQRIFHIIMILWT